MLATSRRRRRLVTHPDSLLGRTPWRRGLVRSHCASGWTKGPDPPDLPSWSDCWGSLHTPGWASICTGDWLLLLLVSGKWRLGVLWTRYPWHVESTTSTRPSLASGGDGVPHGPLTHNWSGRSMLHWSRVSWSLRLRSPGIRS